MKPFYPSVKRIPRLYYWIAWADVYKRQHHMRAASNPKYVYYTGKTDTLAKKVSKSAYNKYFNKYYKGYKKYRMLDNTTANRCV